VLVFQHSIARGTGHLFVVVDVWHLSEFLSLNGGLEGGGSSNVYPDANETWALAETVLESVSLQSSDIGWVVYPSAWERNTLYLSEDTCDLQGLTLPPHVDINREVTWDEVSREGAPVGWREQYLMFHKFK